MLEDLDLQSGRTGRDDLESALWGIVRLREVNEDEARDARLLKPRRDVGGLLIGQVPERALDAPLQAVRIGPILEHFGTIVGLQQNEVTASKKRRERGGGTTEIGRESNPKLSGGNAKRDLRRIMRQAQRFYDEGPDNDGTAGDKRPAYDATTRSQKKPLIVRIERRVKSPR